MIAFTNQIIRECKGAALSVFILLILNPGGVSQGFLERASGYTDKSVAAALAYLSETGRAVRTGAGWQLATAVQVPLPLVNQESLPCGDNSDTNSLCRNNSDSIIIIKQDSFNLINESNNNNKGEIRNNSDSDKSSQDLAEIWEVLAQASVKRNERTEKMARLPHITPDYVLAKRLEFVQEQKGGAAWTGLFIRALEAGEPGPGLNKRRHLETCTCELCRKDRARDLFHIGVEDDE